MFKVHESCHENLLISTDPARLDLAAITDMLSRTYWAKGRTREVIARYVEHSLVFGVYDGGKQIGLARIVSDYTTFAWLCDVFIVSDQRGKDLGKWLIQSVVSHPRLSTIRRIVLATRDAHGLYQEYGGFTPLVQPERWMERFKPSI